MTTQEKISKLRKELNLICASADFNFDSEISKQEKYIKWEISKLQKQL